MAIASPVFIRVPDVNLFTPSGMGLFASFPFVDRVKAGIRNLLGDICVIMLVEWTLVGGWGLRNIF